MPFLTGNCPFMRVWVRAEFLHDLQSKFDHFYEADVVGVTSIPGRVLSFHLLLRDGAMYGEVPITALAQDATQDCLTPRQAQWWDCFSYDFTICTFERLKGLRAECLLRDKPHTVGGQYLWTIDWCSPDPQRFDTGVSEFPAEKKCGHLFALEGGNFALLPNNKVRWIDPAFVVEPPRTSYLRNTHAWSAERGAPAATGTDKEIGHDDAK